MRAAPGAGPPPSPTCEECAPLASHSFRSADDLIHALRVAAEEMGRGALVRLGADEAPGVAEREALNSAWATGALPARIDYRFECAACGARFALAGDPASGEGSWTREDDGAQAGGTAAR